MLRWIDELNGIVGAGEKAKTIRDEIRRIRKEPNNAFNRQKIRQLYEDLDAIQFKPDYMCLIIDRVKDYYRACQGFTINGIEYVRLLGTNGGIKNSTIVFVSKRLSAELRRRIDNGRDLTKELVPAKLEAYKALTCSASIPVSAPHGVLVVDDCSTSFLSDVVYIDDSAEGEPEMELRKNEQIELNASDGFGLMLPSLAQRWSSELELNYIASGFGLRFSFAKGMVFTFDFLDFAERVAGGYIVRDIWGVERDIRDVELVLTASMVKLYDSYSSCESYLAHSFSNGYTFGVTKTCPEELESERTSNYQFLQSFDLSDDDIDELVAPTMETIYEILDTDPAKMILFLKGCNLTERAIRNMQNDFVKALIIYPDLIHDPYIQNKLFGLIKGQILRAKVGVLKMHANYSVASGDPYALCQSIFGMPVTGLLRSGEIYNRYWCDNAADDLVCFRAPMTCHPNVRSVHPNRTDAASYWYRYIRTATIFNDWDTSCMALNGMDYDGDMVMLTDNPVLVRRHKPMPALMCVQRKAEKKIPTEDDTIKSNIDSFGDDIGRTTNYVTSMFEVQSRFDPDSEEYRVLDYRICCGQLYQQNAIDKAKGIICKPMPAAWYDKFAVYKNCPEDRQEQYVNILSDRKPYFMRYIYPDLMRRYNTYIKNTNKNSIREFKIAASELASIPEQERTDRQNEFLHFYYTLMPVGLGDCVMNRICRKFENQFDGHIKKYKSSHHFDPSILKSDAKYTKRQMDGIRVILNEYNSRVKDYAIFFVMEKVDEEDRLSKLAILKEDFSRRCDEVCPDKNALCNILVDLCYRKNDTKKLIWDLCADEIIENLLRRSDNLVSFPVPDPNGPILFGGQTYKITTIELGDEDEYNP